MGYIIAFGIGLVIGAVGVFIYHKWILSKIQSGMSKLG